jgi:TRAP-type C4-dicarboxylate transport system permease small subunit
MPKLIRLYIVNVAIGFALAAVFVALLVWQDVAGLRHLILGSDMGWVAALMMVMFHGVVFAGVQFAIAVMRMAEPPEGPRGGSRAPHLDQLAPVRLRSQK